jgi:HK97 gp10 family phage protein
MTPEMAGVFLEGLVKNEVRNTQIKAGMRVMRAANQLRNAELSVLTGPSPSSAGNPPGVRSGNLRRNWSFCNTGGGGEFVIGIQSDMHYSGYLEHGTRKMAARPYVEKIKETALPNIIPIFEELG